MLDEDAKRFYPDWDTAADTCVAKLTIYAAEPASRTAEALTILASWTALETAPSS